MRPDLWEAVSAKFIEALELPDDGRAAFLDGLLAADPTVHKEVASLLKAHMTAGGFLEKPHTERLTAMTTTSRIKAPPKEFPPGATVGGFEIVKALGKGSFAIVYLARDLALGRLIALKISRVRGNEAKTMASLEHDHIVRVFSEQVEAAHEVRLICMQYIAGASLRRVEAHVREVAGHGVLTGKVLVSAVDALCVDPPAYDSALAKERERFERWSWPEAVACIGARIAMALEHAHRIGVLHLDVKPDNILISPYARPFLADFNVSISRERDEDEMLGGTFSYMAPEHRKAYKVGTSDAFRALSPRTDVYALGVVLFELLTGKHPRAKDVEQLDRTAALPEAQELRLVIEGCLAEDPDARYGSAAELASRLDGFLGLVRLRRALPRPGLIARVTEISLVLGLSLFVTGPQVIGSLVNIAYNASRIVAQLTAAQRHVFETMLWIMNPIFYGVGVTILVRYILPLHRMMRDEGRGHFRALGDAERAALRQRALHLPRVVSAVTTSCWAAGCISFPLGIHLFGGPLSKTVFLHFGVSFFLSWVVALTYSFLYVQFAVIRVVYPKLLVGDEDSRATAGRELTGVGAKLQLFQAMAGLIPSLAATLLLGSESFVADPTQIAAYRWLLVGLIGTGIVGFLVALRTSAVLTRIIYALTTAEDGGVSRNPAGSRVS